MSDGTKIEWTDATLNVVNGCSIVSPGCTNCYAMRSGGRNLPNHPATGLTKATKAGHVWTGEVRFNEAALLLPLRWKRPRKIFWNAHGDLFHENVPDEWIDRCFAVMALTPHHVHQVLTKRPERMRAYMSERSTRRSDGRGGAIGMLWEQLGTPKHERIMESFVWPLPNVWLGVSVEDQARADERVPVLLGTPAAVRWLSCEPLLGTVDLTRLRPPGCTWLNAMTGHMHTGPSVFREFDHAIDWVVAGGESGPGARPMHPDWARSLRDQCTAAGVPFLFKQWGEWLPSRNFAHMELSGNRISRFDKHKFDDTAMYRIGKKRAGRLLDGVQHDGYPQQ